MAKHLGNKRRTNKHARKSIQSYAEQLESRVLLSTDLFVTDSEAGTIGKYDGTGTTVNSELISGLTGAGSIAVSGPDLFVVAGQEIGEYTTAGTTVNSNLITLPTGDLGSVYGIAVSGSSLFVTYSNGSTSFVGEYTTAGTTVNSQLVTDTGGTGISVAGSDLFVVDQTAATIGEFTTSGAAVNPTLITLPTGGQGSAYDVAVSGSNLFVTYSNTGNSFVGEYTTAGTTINAQLISESGGTAIAVSGSNLYVMDQTGESIGEYNTSGTTVNADLLSDFESVAGIAVAASTGTPQLTFSQEPVSATNTETLGSVVVDIEDSNGNLLTTDTSHVTLSIASGTAGAALGGTKTVAAVAGVATFSTLSITTSGTYTLTTTDGSDTAATSTSFVIAPPVLTFNSQPADNTPDSTLLPIVVDIDDPNGNPVTGDNTNVTLAIATSTAGATLAGTTTVAAIDGVATFSTLHIANDGTYTLSATDGTYTAGISATFVIAAPALGFTTEPDDAIRGGTLAPIAVSIEYADGRVITSDDSNVTLAITNGSSGAILSGTTTVAAVDGVATFSGLSINTAGNYILSAADGSYTTTASTAVPILPPYGPTTDLLTLTAAQLASNDLFIDYTWPTTEADLDTGTEYLGSTDGFAGDNDSPYLDWSGDDTSDGGSESVTVDLNLAREQGKWSTSTQIFAKAGWYSGAGGTGPATITVALKDKVTGALTQEDVKTFAPGTQDDLATTVVDTITVNTTAAASESIGGLDTAFGSNGLASNDVGFSSTTGVAADGALSVLIGPIGSAPSDSFGVTRYNADGSLDTTFDTTFGTAGVTSTSFGATDDVPRAVDVLANGNILVAGTATNYTDDIAAGSEFAIAEYNADGSLDTSFGGGTGEALISFSNTAGTLSNDVLNSIAVGSGGAIYLGGSSDAGGNGSTDFAIAALTSTGAIDGGYGSNGKMLQSFGAGDDSLNSLALQTNGDIVAAGSAEINGTTEIALARFLPSGVLDDKFGAKGLVTTNVRGVYDSASSVVIQPKGQIVIGGLSASGSGPSLSSDFVVVRYTTAGKIDKSFGGGPVITSFGQPSAVTQVVLQTSGDIIASGKTTASLTNVTPDALDVAVARYTTSGKLDTTFNGSGKTIIDLSQGVVSTAETSVGALAEFTLEPLETSNLGSQFDAFDNSLQGVVSITPGGEILAAGNSGANTVEAELITAGVNLVVSLLTQPPAAVTGGMKGSTSVKILESGTDTAAGTVTLVLEVSTDAYGDAATSLKSLPEKISLRPAESKTYKITFNYPTTLSTGDYYLVATVNNGTSAALKNLNAAGEVAASTNAVDIAPPFISLDGSDLSAGSAFTIGKTVTAIFDVANNGNIIAKGATTAGLYLSTDQTAEDGTQVDVAKLSVSLASDKSKVYRVSFKLPSTVSPGTYYLIAVVDPVDSLGTTDQTESSVVDSTQLNVG